MGLVEHTVPERNELVAKTDGVPNGGHFVRVVEPGLSSASVEVGVCPHEWIEGSSLGGREGAMEGGGRERERERERARESVTEARREGGRERKGACECTPSPALLPSHLIPSH